MRLRKLTATAWILAVAVTALPSCLDPTLPRIPPEEDKERDDQGGDETGLDLAAPPLFYLV